MKRIYLLLGALLALSPVFAQNELKLMTYNVRNAIGLDEVCDYQRVADVIRNAAPDAVAVQELDSVTQRSNQKYVLGELAELTQMYAVYQPAIEYGGGKYGIGILSRQKPLRTKALALPGREEQRALVLAEFEDFVFACTHLSLTEEDRLASLELIRKCASRSPKPFYLAGDLNATPESDFIQGLQQDFEMLNDARQPTHPADAPANTLDYIAVWKQTAPKHEVVSREVLEEPVASDHRPVAVRLRVMTQAQSAEEGAVNKAVTRSNHKTGKQFTPGMMPDLSVLGKVSAATYNAGPGLANDSASVTLEDALMKVITNTTAKRLAAYTQTLEKEGYKPLNRNTLDGDTYYTYEKDGTLFYLYHTSHVGETRVIVDNCSDPLSKLANAYTPKAGDTAELYQYSLNYDLANHEGYDPVVYTEKGSANCGMCYIIKLPDNSVIMVDGAIKQQSTEKSRAGLVNFLKEITHTPKGGKVKVAMWYFTHAHDDHLRMAADILDEYSDEIDLVSVAHNFTSYHQVRGGYDDDTFFLKDVINARYPNVLFHKLHTGEVFTMAGVKIEVVYTHEDATTAEAASEVEDYNSASTVLKITMDGQKIMMLGDISELAESVIAAMHSTGYMRSDAVQATHHCFNYLYVLYPMINAKIALFPQSMFNLKDPGNCASNLYKYRLVMEYADEEYFAHKYTYKFTVVNGKLTAKALPRYDAR